ncbi:hypothetical protein FQN50_000580 [Emmonsiellopsis sp. PD_5]|nr:hypothetical protein FQN50_000580 [Emmonsiellopsis sp. PD_5]
MQTSRPAIRELPDPSQTDDIIRVACHFQDHSNYFHPRIEQINPQDHAQIKTSIGRPFPRTPSASLGNLDILPLEIVHEICLLLDIRSIIRFRHVNLRASVVVSASKEYRAITSLALDALRAMFVTDHWPSLASNKTLRDLFGILTSQHCSLCRRFGGNLVLPSFARFCTLCWWTIEETYSYATYVDEDGCVELGTKVHALLFRVRGLIGDDSVDIRPTGVRFSSSSERKLSKLLSLADGETLREFVNEPDCIAIAPLPYLDITTGRAERGMSCKGCKIARFASKHSAFKDSLTEIEKYSRATYPDHYRTCSLAETIWEMTKGGRISVLESEFAPRTAEEKAKLLQSKVGILAPKPTDEYVVIAFALAYPHLFDQVHMDEVWVA